MKATILGSLLAGIYSVFLVLPQGLVLPPSVLEGIDQALRVAETLPADAAQRLTEAVRGAFDAAYTRPMTPTETTAFVHQQQNMWNPVLADIAQKQQK